jgi:hypothetical protein
MSAFLIDQRQSTFERGKTSHLGAFRLPASFGKREIPMILDRKPNLGCMRHRKFVHCVENCSAAVLQIKRRAGPAMTFADRRVKGAGWKRTIYS